jgi:HYDIN/CFA65/VesB family protein
MAAAIVLGLAIPAAAHASTGIGAHGAPTEASGWFPEWYEDAAGTKLELCVEGPYCATTIEGGLPDPESPASFPDNFPDEMFWWSGDATLTYPGGTATLTMAQEAAFLNGFVRDGDQTAFGRVRIRATGLTPNAWYRFTYPFGSVDLQAVDKAPRVVNYTSDVGCMTPPCDDAAYSTLSGSDVGPEFLQWDATESAPPDGYIGNPALPHRVTGSRFIAPGESEPANYFRIERITGKGGSVVSAVGKTDDFLISGKLVGDPHGHFAGAPVRFGDREVGTNSERTATIRNTGAGDLTLGRPRIAGDDVDDFDLASGGSCELPGTLKPGETCTVRVAFSPAVARDHSARLEVPEEHGGTATTRSIAVTGTGTVRPAPVVLPAAPAAPAAPAIAPAPAPAPSTGVLDQRARSSRATIRTLSMPATISRAHVRAEGLRLVLRIRGEANVVRVRIYRTRDNKRGARVAELFRSPTSNPVRLRLGDRDLRRRLTAGFYRIEIAAGTSRSALGAATTRTLRVR